MYCVNCRRIVKKSANFCPYCGGGLVEETDDLRREFQYYEEAGYGYIDQNDYGAPHKMGNKTAAIVAYFGIIGIVITWIKGDHDNPLVKFHINQSIVFVGLSALLSFLPLPRSLQSIIFFILFGLSIYGIYEAANERMNGIPFIRQFKFLK